MIWFIVLWLIAAVVWLCLDIWHYYVDWPFIGITRPWMDVYQEVLALSGIVVSLSALFS